MTQLVVTMAENVGVQDNLQHISFSVFVYRLKSKIMLLRALEALVGVFSKFGQSQASYSRFQASC